MLHTTFILMVGTDKNPHCWALEKRNHISYFNSTYCDENVWFYAGNLSCHEMSVFLTWEISCVQQLKRMTVIMIRNCVKVREQVWMNKLHLPSLLQSQSWTWLLPKHDLHDSTKTWCPPPLSLHGSWWSRSCPCFLLNRFQCTACHPLRCCYRHKETRGYARELDLYKTFKEQSLYKNLFKSFSIPDFHIVWKQPAVNGFGGMGHESPPFETCLLKKPWQGSTMIQVKTGREKEVSRI